jgi:hypothetical protein
VAHARRATRNTRASAMIAPMAAARSIDDVVVAGLAGAALSGLPSTAWTVLRGEDVLAGARAAGTLLLPRERRPGVLLLAAVPVHLALSLGWAAVLAVATPHRAEPAWGLIGGVAIAALDLGVIGRRLPAIRSLPQGRQWADHLAFGLTVGLALRARRRARPAHPGA